MGKFNERHDPTDRVAAGLKTALLVCVIGFIALVANRALVAPGGASAAEAPAAHSIIAPDARTPVLLPRDDDSIAAQRSSSGDSAAQYEGGDNHPPSF